MLNLRVLIVRKGCPHCREAMKVVIWLNMRLPIGKQIKIFDNFRWEEFGLKEHPIMDKLEKDGFDAYPFFMTEGIVIENAQAELLKSYLEGYLKKDFLF